MVTVAVAALLLTLAAPSFREMIQRNKARSVTSEFNTALAQASEVLPTPPLPVKKRNGGGLVRK